MSEYIYTITEFLLGGCLLYGSYYCYEILSIDRKNIYQGHVLVTKDGGLPRLKDLDSKLYYIDSQYDTASIKNGNKITLIGEQANVNNNILLIPGHPRSGIYTNIHPISLIKRYLG